MPEDVSVGLNEDAPVAVQGQALAKLQLRLCFTPKFSTDKRAWRTNDSKDGKNRVKRDKSCGKIIKLNDEETVPVAAGDTVTFEWKVPAATPLALWYP